jgi:ornithine carbamoyltransferase
MRHILSLSALDQDAFLGLIQHASRLADSPHATFQSLSGRSVAIEFRKTSTRTRISFAAAAARLGAIPIMYGSSDLQTNTGETIEDTVTVLSSFVEMLVIRTAADPAELALMASLDRLPIINAMTADEHPTQALSDFAVLQRRFGDLSGLRFLYTGEANNTAVALAYGASRLNGLRADFRTPPGYGFASPVLERINTLCRRFGGAVTESHDPPTKAVVGANNIIYTSRWQTTGTTKCDPNWRNAFVPFRVSESLFPSTCDTQNRVFMHDLPAVRGEECDGTVLDGPLSIAFPQAQQKLYTAMSIILWCARK